jgi:hypothetical protein
MTVRLDKLEPFITWRLEGQIQPSDVFDKPKQLFLETLNI